MCGAVIQTKRKNIVFIHHSSAIGGGSYCLLRLIECLDKEKYNPIVLLKVDGPIVKELKSLNTKVALFPQMEAVPYNKTLFSFYSIYTYIKIFLSHRNFRNKLKELEADIVYLNNMMLYPYLKDAKELDIKTLIHVREHWPLDEHQVQFSWARKCVKKFADELIAINKYSAKMFSPQAATIVHDWIDMESRRGGPHLNDLISDYNPQFRYFLYTGGYQPIKGALEVAKTFSQNIRGDQYKLLMLGITNDSIFGGLRGKIKKVLSIIGLKTYKEKVNALVKKDDRIVVIPSLYNLTNLVEEVDGVISYFTIPHANLAQAEAIILGTPVVAARTPESLEYSLNGDLSILFKMNDFIDFTNAINYLINNTDNVKSNIKSKNGTITKIFEPQNNINQLHNCLNRL